MTKSPLIWSAAKHELLTEIHVPAFVSLQLWAWLNKRAASSWQGEFLCLNLLPPSPGSWGFKAVPFRRDWVECGTDCHGLVGKVVISQKLDSMILVVFSNLSDSMSPCRVWAGWFQERMVQGVWCCTCGYWDRKESLICKPVSLWAQYAWHALGYIYTHIYTIFIPGATEGLPFSQHFLEQDPCGDAGQEASSSTATWWEKGNLCSLDKCPGQKLENLTEKSNTLKHFRKSTFQRHVLLYQYCYWQYMSILEHSTISVRYNASVLF